MPNFESTSRCLQCRYACASRARRLAPRGGRGVLAVWLSLFAFVVATAGCGKGGGGEGPLPLPTPDRSDAAAEGVCRAAAAPLTVLVAATEAEAETLRSQLARMEPPAFAGPYVIVAAQAPASETLAIGPAEQLWLARQEGARMLDMRPRP